jgi:threonine/homoserine/homoserine lactone efflux protein
MNWELFTAFLLITAVLVITPGPIVTLVIATGASQGIRAALTTVAGTTLGNAILLAAIAFGLSWVARHPGVASRRRQRQRGRSRKARAFLARLCGRAVQP